MDGAPYLLRRLRRLGTWAALATGAACGTDSTTQPPPVAATLVGRVSTLDDGSPSGLVASAQWQNTENSAAVAPDGSFMIPFPVVPQGPGTLTVSDGELDGAYHPAWLRLSQLPTVPLDLVQLPIRWRIRNGIYAGQEVRVRPSDAAESRVQASYWGFGYAHTQDGARQMVIDSTRWTGGLTTWPRSSFPVPMALDRGTSTSAFTTADSVDLWLAVARLENHLGYDAFEPARVEELEVTVGEGGATASRAVLVRIDSMLPFSGRTRIRSLPSDWLIREEVGDWSDGFVSEMAVVSIDLDGAVVELREGAAFRRSELLIHELMHALGVGHGCEWPSVQTYCASLAREVPTPEDIAHLEVLERTRQRAREMQTMHGILAAVFGERILSLGLSPFPAPGVVYGPDSAPRPAVPGR